MDAGIPFPLSPQSSSRSTDIGVVHAVPSDKTSLGSRLGGARRNVFPGGKPCERRCVSSWICGPGGRSVVQHPAGRALPGNSSEH